MKNKRKRHDSQFKARVALEALKGLKTVQQIAKEFGIHPGQVSDWKRLLSEQAGSVFEGGKSREVVDFDKEREGAPGSTALTTSPDFTGLPPSSSCSTTSSKVHDTL